MNLIERAQAFAKLAHKDQKRRYTGEPYYNHVYSVAKRVAKINNDPTLIVAALLHDTVEDTNVIIEEIGLVFGLRVAELVYDLTDHFTPENYPNLNRAKRKKLEAIRLGETDEDVKLIKRCDIEDNTSSIVDNDPGFARIYLKEKEFLLAQLDAP